MSTTYEQVQEDSREYAAAQEKELDPLVKRAKEVAVKVDDFVSRMASATATRKSLDIGDEDYRYADPATFRKERAEDSLHRAVSALLASPQMPSRNGHQSEED